MIAVKLICCIIALFCTLLYISNIITAVTADPYSIHMNEAEMNRESTIKDWAVLRLILSVIMSITWSIVIIL